MGLYSQSLRRYIGGMRNSNPSREQLESFWRTRLLKRSGSIRLPSSKPRKRCRIDAQIAELRQMLGRGKEPATAGPKPKARRFSAATRRRMKEGQQRRWAKVRGESTPAA